MSDAKDIQLFKKDQFNYVLTKEIDRKKFSKEMEEIYNKRYKDNYEQDGFRKGHVPFDVAILNGELSSSVLQTVAQVNRQIFVEEIVKRMIDIGSIYDITDGEEQTDFGSLDLSLEEPILLQLNVEIASYVDKVDFEGIAIDKDVIKTKPSTEKELEELFTEYKKVKEQQNKATKTSYVELVFDDGKDQETLTFNLGQKFDDEETDTLKVQTHKEISEIVLGKSIGDTFDYVLIGKDGSKLDVKAEIKDVYRVKTLSDEEFVSMLKESGNVPEEEKENLTIARTKEFFKDHLNKIYEDNYEEEVKSLTFAALNNATEGIHYNEHEIETLKNQFILQVQKVASEDGVPYADYVVKNFGSQKLMEDYVDASQRVRVLQAAIYRNIGKTLGVVPTYTQLEGFVKHFLFQISPSEELEESLALQINEQVTLVLSEPLNRQRVIESWASVRAEDHIDKKIGLLKQ